MRRLLVSVGLISWCLAVPDARATAQLPAGSRAGTSGSAVVRGRVVVDDTGQPIRRAGVYLQVVLPPARRAADGAPVQMSTTTDANGQFEFTGVPAGSVRASASLDGYYDPRLERMGATIAGAPAQLQPVAEGQVLDNITLRLLRAGAIVGRVVDEFGDPASSVEIEVLSRTSSSRRPRWTTVGRRTESDDTGAFRAWGLPPGTYIVCARPRQLQVQSTVSLNSEREGFAPTCHPGTAALADADAVTVRAGRDTTGVTFGLLATRLASIRGRVLGAGESPAPRVTVMVSRLDRDRSGSGGSGSSAGPDGTFEVTRLPPGRYRLAAREGADGPWRPLTRMGVVEVDVDGADVEGIAISLQPGSTVSGRVVDETGQPLREQLRVRFDSDDQGNFASVSAPVAVGDDGTFRAENVFGRQYVRLLTTGAAPRPLETAWAQPPSSQSPAPRLAMTSVRVAGEDVTDRPVVFDGRPVQITVTVTSQPAEVTGTVQWVPAAGEAAATRPSVIVFPDDPGRWHEWSVSVRPARVSAQGQFSIRGIPPGDRYLIVAVDSLPPGDHLVPEVLEALRASARPIRIDPGSRQEISLAVTPHPLP